MHWFTGLVVQAQQWLGIVEKDDENAENEAQENSEEEEEAEGKPQGHMQSGKGQCSFRAKTEGFADARALVQLWIDTAPSIELGESQTSLAGVADTHHPRGYDRHPMLLCRHKGAHVLGNAGGGAK